MAAVTTEKTRPPLLPPVKGRAGLGGTLRSEVTKIRSVRSTYWTMIVLLVITIGIGALVSWLTGSHWDQASASQKAGFDPTSNALVGLFFGQFVIVVLGAMTITSEYSTGMIRTTLAAMPRRGVFLLAKGLVFTVVAHVLSVSGSQPSEEESAVHQSKAASSA